MEKLNLEEEVEKILYSDNLDQLVGQIYLAQADQFDSENLDNCRYKLVVRDPSVYLIDLASRTHARAIGRIADAINSAIDQAMNYASKLGCRFPEHAIPPSKVKSTHPLPAQFRLM